MLESDWFGKLEKLCDMCLHVPRLAHLVVVSSARGVPKWTLQDFQAFNEKALHTAIVQLQPAGTRWQRSPRINVWVYS